MVRMLKVRGEVKRETDKAICVQLAIALCDGEPRTTDVWLPRSQITKLDGGWAVPAWLMNRKADELEARLHGESVFFETVEVIE